MSFTRTSAEPSLFSVVDQEEDPFINFSLNDAQGKKGNSGLLLEGLKVSGCKQRRPLCPLNTMGRVHCGGVEINHEQNTSVKIAHN